MIAGVLPPGGRLAPESYTLTNPYVYIIVSCMSPKKKPRRPIYNRVRLLRVERDVSRAELAAAVDVNPQSIGALERGDHSPSLDLAFSICEFFDLPVEAVFSRTEFSPLSSELYQRI